MSTQTLNQAAGNIPFADLTIRCGGRLFEVHRAIICRQSEVLKSALLGNFVVSEVTQSLLTDITHGS